MSGSLLDAPVDPATGKAAEWLLALLGGSAALSLCVIAVALLGMLMLTGRMPLRRGLHVVLGCFLVLGASTIAAGLREAGGAVAANGEPPEPVVINYQPPPKLPPANYDPYAGASLRRE